MNAIRIFHEHPTMPVGEGPDFFVAYFYCPTCERRFEIDELAQED